MFPETKFLEYLLDLKLLPVNKIIANGQSHVFLDRSGEQYLYCVFDDGRYEFTNKPISPLPQIKNAPTMEGAISSILDDGTTARSLDQNNVEAAR